MQFLTPCLSSLALLGVCGIFSSPLAPGCEKKQHSLNLSVPLTHSCTLFITEVKMKQLLRLQHSTNAITFHSEWGLDPGGLGAHFLFLRTVAHTCSQRPPTQGFLGMLPLNGFPCNPCKHAWLLLRPLLVSVLFSPAQAVTLLNVCSSRNTGYHGIVDFLKYSFLYCSGSLMFLLHLLPQLPKVPHVVQRKVNSHSNKTYVYYSLL